jgi:hypothetical protein
MLYSTSIDKNVKITIIAFSFLFAVPLINLTRSEHYIMYSGGFFFYLVFLFIIYMFKPLKYELDKNSLIIHKLIGKIIINTRDIKKVEKISFDLVKNEPRSEVLGYFGKLVISVGNINWFGTRKDKLILICLLDNTKILVTPDKYEEFYKQLETEASSQQELLQCWLTNKCSSS